MVNLNSCFNLDEPSKKPRATDIIQPTSFYTVEAEKVKLNWFCYELALSVFDQIIRDLGKKLKKHKRRQRDRRFFGLFRQTNEGNYSPKALRRDSTGLLQSSNDRSVFS